MRVPFFTVIKASSISLGYIQYNIFIGHPYHLWSYNAPGRLQIIEEEDLNTKYNSGNDESKPKQLHKKPYLTT